jgi:histidine triad (HIT) family protein
VTKLVQVSSDCLFCKVAAGEIPASQRYADEHVVAFDDINPQAPTHVLVIPRVHVMNILELADQADLAGHFIAGIKATVELLGLADFRTVMNTGADAGQSVFHLHAHLLAGRTMGWPPG